MFSHKIFTFANIASAAALVIATTGGGLAVAAEVGRNAIASAQIKNGAVRSVDVRNDSLTGKDIKESTLGTVPSAIRATSAGTVDTVVTKRVTTSPGPPVAVVATSTLIVELQCVDNGNNNLQADLFLRTSADNAAVAASQGNNGDLDAAEQPVRITSSASSVPSIQDGQFSAVSAQGASMKGYGYVFLHPGGANTCQAEVTLVG